MSDEVWLAVSIVCLVISIGLPIFNYIHTNRLYKKTLENQRYVEERRARESGMNDGR